MIPEELTVPVSPKKPKTLWKILIPIIILGLGVGGYFAYKSDLFQKAFQKNETPVAIIQTEPTPPVENTTPANPVADTLTAPEKDCGVSTSADIVLASGTQYLESNISKLEIDPAIKCMGEHIAQCSSAKISFVTDIPKSTNGPQLNPPEPTLQIFNKEGVCYFKVTDKAKKRLNKYNQCPLNTVRKINQKSNTFIALTDTDKNDPAKYTIFTASYGLIGFAVDMSHQIKETDDLELFANEMTDKYKTLGCSGDLFPLMLESFRSSR